MDWIGLQYGEKKKDRKYETRMVLHVRNNSKIPIRSKLIRYKLHVRKVHAQHVRHDNDGVFRAAVFRVREVCPDYISFALVSVSISLVVGYIRYGWCLAGGKGRERRYE